MRFLRWILLFAAAWLQPLHSENVPTITIRLSSFAFAPDRLQLRVGAPVRIRLVNGSGGGHNFSAPQFFAASAFPAGPPPAEGKVEVTPNGSADVTLIPRMAGTYRFECTHFLHSLFGMTGTIVVIPP